MAALSLPKEHQLSHSVFVSFPVLSLCVKKKKKLKQIKCFDLLTLFNLLEDNLKHFCLSLVPTNTLDHLVTLQNCQFPSLSTPPPHPLLFLMAGISKTFWL